MTKFKSILCSFILLVSAVSVTKNSFAITAGPGSRTSIISGSDDPYILTPKPSDKPRINGAKVTAARPARPFLYKIPVSGLKPMTYFAENLPESLTVDKNTGIITGSVSKPGEYIVKIKATNSLGEASRDLKIVIGDELCLTPPMGWNSWNCWGLSVDEAKMKSTIDVFVQKGLADHGWSYVNIDDGWEAPARDENGKINPNDKFGSMKNLADYAHSNGLKLGIYSSPGPTTCGGYLGSYQHELDDAQTYADWGIDYLKYDWCSYGEIEKGKTLEAYQKPYLVMQAAFKSINRDIVYSLCQYGMGKVWTWGDQVGAQLWRTSGDITDTWSSMKIIGFSQEKAAPYARPGHWNDPDMLVVGYVGWGPNLHPSKLTPDEQYTHISLWAMLAAPLMLGCDLSRLDDFTLNLITNDEVIDVNQDPLGKEAVSVVKEKDYAVYVKDLEDGSKAVALFNTGNKEREISITWEQLGITGDYTIRDLWRQAELGTSKKNFGSTVPKHGVVLVKISKL
jgi:alpha-galactosidase